MTPLRLGSTGPDVRNLQLALAQFFNAPTPFPDGVFGTATQGCVRAFQAQRGMVVDGIAGPATLTALNLAPPSAPSVAAVTAVLLDHLRWADPVGYAPPMDAACKAYGIIGRTRLADFLAQTGHESGGGKWTSEIWGPTTAQRGYEGRLDLGNTQPGDGARFRGRGLIQITGRDGYERASKALGVALDVLPAWLETRDGAVTSAAWWWVAHGCNEISDSGDFIALTKRINGGTNGLADRLDRRVAALAALPT